jgi:uncharacterized Ntn-hydrolase superfamily protein
LRIETSKTITFDFLGVLVFQTNWKNFGFAILMSSLLMLDTASATFSVIASNKKSGQAGLAMVSCVEALPLWVSIGASPGHGAIVAQGFPNLMARDEGQLGLEFGATPQDVKDYIATSQFDPQLAERQYGIVDVSGNAAGFTGANLLPTAKDVQGTFDQFAFSAQGNTLTDASVVDLVTKGFQEKPNNNTFEVCELAERLMTALESVPQNSGDRRCALVDGRPGNSAFIQVDLPGKVPGNWLALQTGVLEKENPVAALRKQFNKWKFPHCLVSQFSTFKREVRPGLSLKEGKVNFEALKKLRAK